MDAKLSSYSAPKVRAFLKQFALDVDQERLQHILPHLRDIVAKQKHKPGVEFKVLLQQLDHQIDWQLAAELEDNFLD